MQQIFIAGNVGKDAVTKDVNGQTVTEWSVAVKGVGNNPDTWFKCSMWGNRGPKIAGYIKAGGKITVTGALQAGVYNDKPDLKINVSEVTLQSSKQDGGQRHDDDDSRVPF